MPDKRREEEEEPTRENRSRYTPGSAEGEPGGNDPHERAPGPTPGKAEGGDRPPRPFEFKHT